MSAYQPALNATRLPAKMIRKEVEKTRRIPMSYHRCKPMTGRIAQCKVGSPTHFAVQSRHLKRFVSRNANIEIGSSTQDRIELPVEHEMLLHKRKDDLSTYRRYNISTSDWLVHWITISNYKYIDHLYLEWRQKYKYIQILDSFIRPK